MEELSIGRKERNCDYRPFKEPMRQEYGDAMPLVQHHDTCLHADMTQHGASELLDAASAWVDAGVSGKGFRLSQVVYDILDLADVDIALALEEFGPCIQQWCPIVPTSFLRGGVDDLAYQVHGRDGLRHPLLLLGLWLVTRRTCPQREHITQSQLYRALKQILALYQCEAPVGLDALQLALLLTVYEVGHGMSQQAFQTMSTCVSIFQLLSLDPRTTTHTSLSKTLSWLQASILMLDNTLAISHLTPGFPVSIPSSSAFSVTLAQTLGPNIPPPPPTVDATCPRKIHIRASVAIAASHVLSYTHALTQGKAVPTAAAAAIPASYATADDKINKCINMLIDKPQPHTWLHCDSIALAFCAHVLLQAVQTRFLRTATTPTSTHDPVVDIAKPLLALRISRRMAWDMVRVGIQVINSAAEIAELPFAGLCCVVRAGVVVLETRDYVDEEVLAGREEARAFRRLVEWFAARWGVGKVYLARVDELLG